MSANSPFKRGIVRQNDPENARSRVEFQDEEALSAVGCPGTCQRQADRRCSTSPTKVARFTA